MNRKRLPDTRASITKKGQHGNLEFYVHVGFFPDTEQPGEVFIKIGKHGSDVEIFVDGFCTMVSTSLQYGVSWSKIKEKFSNYPTPNVLQIACELIDEAVTERQEITEVSYPNHGAFGGDHVEDGKYTDESKWEDGWVWYHLSDEEVIALAKAKLGGTCGEVEKWERKTIEKRLSDSVRR